MNRITKFWMTMFGLLLLLAGVAACGGSKDIAATAKDSAALTQTLPDGNELVIKMKEAIKAVDKAHFTTQFQVATSASEQGVRGNLEVWGQHPSNIRLEITSENPNLDKVAIGVNQELGWAYSPTQLALYVDNAYPGYPYLGQEFDLRQVLKIAHTLYKQGLNDIEATTLSSEQINGRDTYQVQVKYNQIDDPELNLDNVTSTFWIDQETFLPQKVELAVTQENVTGKAMLTLKGGFETDITPEEELFSPSEFPEGTSLIDLEQAHFLFQIASDNQETEGEENQNAKEGTVEEATE